MENPLPEIAEFIGDDITEGDFKVALVKLRAYLDELLGVEGTGLNIIPASVGSGTKPVYTDANKNIVASNATVGATNKPVFMENGEIKAISGDIGSASQPVYIANGVLTAANSTSGHVKEDNGALAIGSYALCYKTSKGALLNGSTIAGSSLKAVVITGSTISFSYGGSSTSGTGLSTRDSSTLSGTWRNVSGTSVATSSSGGFTAGIGLFQRTA